MAAARTIRLGDRVIPRIGLGTNRLTHTPGHVAFVRQAVEAGIGMIDTAHLYTGGESEATTGEAAIAASPVVVATKGGYGVGDGTPAILRAQIEQSLRSLRTDVIDLYYLHRVHPGTPLEASLGTIAEFVNAGQIRLVGISHVDVEMIDRARGVVPVAAVQNHYNLRERGSDEVVDYCAAEGLAFVPYFPLRGVDSPALRQIAAQRGVSEAQLALAWLLHRSPAVLPIPGTLSIEHVRENVAALDIALTEAELAELAA